jgi:ricin-type beta-trefoil lectin protein
MQHLRRALIMGLAVVCVGVAVSTPAHADPQPPQQWENWSLKFCIGVAAGNVTNGTIISQWYCNGNTDQGWELDPVTVNGDTWYLFRNATNPNQCLSVANKSKSAGAGLVIWQCKNESDDQDQLWQLSYLPRTPVPLAKIFNFNSGMVIVPSSWYASAQLVQEPEGSSGNYEVWAPCPFTAGVNQGCPGV